MRDFELPDEFSRLHLTFKIMRLMSGVQIRSGWRALLLPPPERFQWYGICSTCFAIANGKNDNRNGSRFRKAVSRQLTQGANQW